MSDISMDLYEDYESPLQTTDFIEVFQPGSGGVRREKQIPINEVGVGGLALTSGRIAIQEKLSVITSSGKWVIAETGTDSYTNTTGTIELVVGGSSRTGKCIIEFAFQDSPSVHNTSNTVIKYRILKNQIGVPIKGVYLLTGAVLGAGAKIAVDFDVAVNLGCIAKISQTAGSASTASNVPGMKLVTAYSDTGKLPDGVTSATYIEAGAEYRTANTFINSSTVKFIKNTNDVIRLTFNWKEIPKQASGITLSYTSLVLYEYNTELRTYTFDGSESVGAPLIEGNEVTVPITKVGAFTNFSAAGNTVTSNSLVATLT